VADLKRWAKKDMSKNSRGGAWAAWIAGPLGLAAGVAVGWLALMIGGAGHGWGSSLISAWSILGAPIAGLSWAYRGRLSGRILAITALAVAIGTDAMLWWRTAEEGTEYVGRVWNALPVDLVLWACLFFSWQFLAIASLKTRNIVEETPNQSLQPTAPSRRG
jgi:hypothetical protein